MPSAAPPPPECRVRTFDQYGISDSFTRTSQSRTHKVYEREAESIKRSQRSSAVFSNLCVIDRWIEILDDGAYAQSAAGANDVPAPNLSSVAGAIDVLRALRLTGPVPEKILPSAEGGIAIIYVGSKGNRAIIESLNDESPFFLLYDLEGRAATIEWPQAAADGRPKIVEQLEAHLRGLPLAPQI